MIAGEKDGEKNAANDYAWTDYRSCVTVPIIVSAL
jgi:hypothetical protein